MKTTMTLTAFTLTALSGTAAADHCSPSHASAESQLGNIVETAEMAGQFKTLLAAAGAAGLVDTLAGGKALTVFAPTDEAFGRLPEGTVEALLKPENRNQLKAILTYHVAPSRLMAKDVVSLDGIATVNGQWVDFSHGAESGVQIDTANIVKTDIECSNGVIHIIDRVIMPASDSIVATAVSAGRFNTLIAAAKAAGLAETLDTKGPFTVLAPTDEAFAKLPEGTIESLLKPANREQLAAILKLHVIPGRIYASDAISTGSAKTLLGEMVKFEALGESASVNDATITATNVDASNGVIHIIDTVLLPE